MAFGLHFDFWKIIQRHLLSVQVWSNPLYPFKHRSKSTFAFACGILIFLNLRSYLQTGRSFSTQNSQVPCSMQAVVYQGPLSPQGTEFLETACQCLRTPSLLAHTGCFSFCSPHRPPHSRILIQATKQRPPPEPLWKGQLSYSFSLSFRDPPPATQQDPRREAAGRRASCRFVHESCGVRSNRCTSHHHTPHVAGMDSCF